MRRKTTPAFTSFLSGNFSTAASTLAVLLLVAGFSTGTHADTLRKRYVFDYDRTTRKASSMAAASKARLRLLEDFLAARFAPEIVNNLKDDIDVALDPPENFLTSFEVVSEKVNEAETQVTLTVEGDVDFAEMVSALVQNKVLSFGPAPPRVMVLPSSRFADPKAAKVLRAMIYDKLKQAGLRPVAFEGATDSVSFRIKDNVTPTSVERQVLVRAATQYGADYLIYIDTEVETQPFSQGGYVTDANFIHTILRPNGALILGESIVSDRGSGTSPMLAFDDALDSVAPVIAKVAIGQLYESIYSDSDVVYNTPKLKQEKTLVINFASAALVQEMIGELKKTGATARLGTGVTDVASRVILETTMDDFALFEWCNRQIFTIAGKEFKTPVVAYAENKIEVEAVADRAAPKQEPLGKGPSRSKRPSGAQSGASLPTLAKAFLKIRTPRIN